MLTFVVVLQLLVALILIGVILFQSGKSQGLSGTIGGIADSYMSKSKAKSMDAKLARATKGAWCRSWGAFTAGHKKTGRAKALPIYSVHALHAGGDHAVEDQGQHNKHSAQPLGAFGQLGIQRTGLALGHVGISNTADGAGQTLALTGLEQNDQDQRQRDEQL